jgi:hypothetical protein
MVADHLPTADVLLTKDTLIHFPNAGIQQFLSRNVRVCPPRFRYVVFVHDQRSAEREAVVAQQVKDHLLSALTNRSLLALHWHNIKSPQNNEDIAEFGRFHPLNMSGPPFHLPTAGMLEWMTNARRVVEVLEPAQLCP